MAAQPWRFRISAKDASIHLSSSPLKAGFLLLNILMSANPIFSIFPIVLGSAESRFFEFVDAEDSRQAKARRERFRYFARPRPSGVRGLPAHAAKLGALHPELLRLPVFQRLHCGHEQRRQGAQARHLWHAPASVTSGLVSSLRFFTPIRLTKNRKFGNLNFWLPNSPRAVPDSACPVNSGATIGRLQLKRPGPTPGNVLDFSQNRRG